MLLSHSVAGAYPLCRPPNTWSPGVPALPGPWYWFVANETPLHWRGGCLAAELLRGAVGDYCLGGCSALLMFLRRSPQVPRVGPVPILAPPLLAVPPWHPSLCLWRVAPLGPPLPSPSGTPFHVVCTFCELGLVALLLWAACPLWATGSAGGHGIRSSDTKQAQHNNRAHNNATPGGTTRSSAAQHRTQGHTAQHGTRQRRPKPGSKPHRKQLNRTARPKTRHNTQQQSTAQHNTETNTPTNTAQRAAAHNTARPGTTAQHATRKDSAARQHQTAQGNTHAPGRGGSRRREPPTGREKKTRARSSSVKNRKTQRGAANTRKQPTSRREAQERRERTESQEAEGQQNKQHTAPRPGHPGPETRESQKQRGRATRKKEKRSTKRQREKQRDTKGGGGSNHQGAANGQAGTTKKARAHREPRSGGPTKQTARSAMA